MNKNILTVLATVGVFSLLAAVAVQERAGRSPASLLQQQLYGAYPYAQSPYAGGYGGGGYPNGGDPYGSGYYGGAYPYNSGYGGGYAGGGYGGYPYGSAAGYPGYAYDEDNAYQQYASQEQYRQWADYAAQQQYEDSAAQANYYNWAAANSYKGKHHDVLKVADKNTNKLVYMGDMEFGGYKHEITGGNDGGYNAPFDINGDGQEIDNWAKVTTQWKHKKGHVQLKQKKLQQLHYVSGAQGKAQVAGIFDHISNSQHGANNGMLKHKALHKPKAAPVDPTLTPVRGIFDSEGNGDVSAKARKQNLRAVKSAGVAHKALMQALETTEENPLNLTLDAIPDNVNSLNGFNEEDTSPEESALRGWDWFHAEPTEIGSGVPARR